MSMTATSHNLLKAPVIATLFDPAITDLTSKDADGIESIWEGWDKPSGTEIVYPYLTYRISWYPADPIGFLIGNMLVDVWDVSPQGNDTRKTEDICTAITQLFDAKQHRQGMVIVRTRVRADEWIQEEVDVGRIHRQIAIELKTIDLVSIS